MTLLKTEREQLTSLLDSGEYDLDGLAEEVFEQVYRLIQARQTLCAVAIKSPTHPDAPVHFFGPYLNKTEAKKAAGLFAHAGSTVEVGRLRPPIQPLEEK
jgi:hypothetical protein